MCTTHDSVYEGDALLRAVENGTGAGAVNISVHGSATRFAIREPGAAHILAASECDQSDSCRFPSSESAGARAH